MRHVPVAQPQTLVGFLRSIGGLKSCTELTLRDARAVWPGLVNDKRGRSLDYGREAAEEAGFIERFSSVGDFLDALDAHPLYRPGDVARLVAWQDQTRVVNPEAEPVETPLDAPFDAVDIANCAELEFDELANLTARAAIAEPASRFGAAKMNDDLARATRAKAWREAQNLSRAALAEKLGFSPSQIQDYEAGARRGKSGDAAVISDDAWKRYELACAALAAGLASPF